jgi:hypothetical protein
MQTILLGRRASGIAAYLERRVWIQVPTNAAEDAIVRSEPITAHQKPMSVFPAPHPSAERLNAMKTNTNQMMPTANPKIRDMLRRVGDIPVASGSARGLWPR